MVANLKPAVFMGNKSEGMLLAASDGNKISLLTPDSDVEEGSNIS